MNPHWGLWRTEEPIDSTSKSSPSKEEPLFFDLDIDVQTQEEQDNTLDHLHQLLVNLTIPQIPTPPSPTLISTQPIFPFLPPPPPPVIPYPTAMTTIAKSIELHIGILESYDRPFETFKQWLNVVQLYLLVNTEVYNNNKKFAFILLYMIKGSALTWAATFHKNVINATGTITLGTYPDFMTKFNKAFKQRDVTGTIITWLTTKWMVLKKD